MSMCVTCWGLNPGLSGASFSSFVPTKVFSPDLKAAFLPFPSLLLPHTIAESFFFPGHTSSWDSFSTRHIADMRLLKFPQKRKTGRKKTNKMAAD